MNKRSLATGLIAATLSISATGCDWNEEFDRHLARTNQDITRIFLLQKQKCYTIADPVRQALCIAKATSEYAKRIETWNALVEARKTCWQIVWEDTLKFLTEILKALGKALGLTANTSHPIGDAGTIGIDGVRFVATGEGHYTLAEGGSFSFNTTPGGPWYEGTFECGELAFAVDGEGQATVDTFEACVGGFGAETVLTLDPDVPGRLDLDPDSGEGWLRVAVDVDAPALGHPMWFIDFPVVADDLGSDAGSITIDTQGEVPGSTVFPILEVGSEGDCDGDGIEDAIAIEEGLATDCDGDGVLDGCQLAGRDCNGNTVIDSCEDVHMEACEDLEYLDVDDDPDAAGWDGDDVGSDALAGESEAIGCTLGGMGPSPWVLGMFGLVALRRRRRADAPAR
jgi:hypothetical protein